MLDKILSSTEAHYYRAQNETRAVTIRDIIIWLQADYGVSVIQQHKPHIRNRLLTLVDLRLPDEPLAKEPSDLLLDGDDVSAEPARFLKPAPKEVIELLESDSEDDQPSPQNRIFDSLHMQKAVAGQSRRTKNDAEEDEDDDDDSVTEERTLSCIEVIQDKFRQAQAANQVICLD